MINNKLMSTGHIIIFNKTEYIDIKYGIYLVNKIIHRLGIGIYELFILRMKFNIYVYFSRLNTISKNNRKYIPLSSLDYIIGYSIIWGKTPEGSLYWYDLNKRYNKILYSIIEPIKIK